MTNITTSYFSFLLKDLNENKTDLSVLSYSYYNFDFTIHIAVFMAFILVFLFTSTGKSYWKTPLMGDEVSKKYQKQEKFETFKKNWG